MLLFPIVTFHAYLMIYVLAAILPAVFLLRYIYNEDKADKEPWWILRRLLAGGFLATIVSMVLELIGETLLNFSYPDRDDALYTIILAFLVVGVVEEGSKFFFLYKMSFHERCFNYRFDGIVYAVFVSLGFAAVENINYVFQYGLGVALPRALLAIPGHMGFAVVMGTFYGQARLYADLHNEHASRFCLFLGWFFAVIMHGIYDTCAMLGTSLSNIIFVLFIIFMYIFVFRLIRWQSAHDEPV